MGYQLVLEDGPSIQIHGRPAQGTTHEVLYGMMTGTGVPVVVKLERSPGTLEREAAMLEALATVDHAIAPRLLAAGVVVIDAQPVPCLIIERRPGRPPSTPAGWGRMGRALGRLAGVRPPVGALSTIDQNALGHQHAERVTELGDRLSPLAAAVPDWDELLSAGPSGTAPLVITHGDPGPGNFLDDGAQGTLIDWEEAHIAPLGLDLARLHFIALLGAGPAGYVARDRQACATAAVDGYRGATPEPWCPSSAQARWWMTVAGVQFIHRRWRLGDKPAPWRDAADTLRRALTDDRTVAQPAGAA